MMFWNTKTFHAQTSAWFGVKERAGLPAKLALPFSLPVTLFTPSLLSSLLSRFTPSQDLTVQAAAGTPDYLPSVSFVIPPFTPRLPPPPLLVHILSFGLWSQLSVLFSVWPKTKCVWVCEGRCVHPLVESCCLLWWCKPQTLKILSHLLQGQKSWLIRLQNVIDFLFVSDYVSFIDSSVVLVLDVSNIHFYNSWKMHWI